MKLSEHEIFKYVTQHIMDPQLWAIALDLQILIDQQEKEHAALKRGNEAGRQFAIWFSAIWEDEDYRKDGGGRTHAELLDYIMAVFPDALLEEQEDE